jgi:hypothetical protein
VLQIISLSMKNMDINFQFYYPLFKDVFAVRIACFAAVVFMFIYGLMKSKAADLDTTKYKFIFLLGLCGTLFVAIICINYKMDVVFDPRYSIFSVPFCTLFLVYFFHLLYNSVKKPVFFAVLAVMLILPAHRFIHSQFGNRGLPCSDLAIADRIEKGGVHKVGVSTLVHAVFINCLLPKNYDITYYLNPASSNAKLYGTDKVEEIPITGDDLIVLY